MWELDVKKAEHQIWYFRIVVLDKTLESPLDSKEIKLVNPKGNQPWIFTGRTNAKAEALITWPPDVKKWLIGKNPEAGEDWGQEKKGSPEDGWMACVWANSGRQWRTGKPGVLQSMGSRRVRHDRASEQQQERTSSCCLPSIERFFFSLKFSVSTLPLHTECNG